MHPGADDGRPTAFPRWPAWWSSQSITTFRGGRRRPPARWLCMVQEEPAHVGQGVGPVLGGVRAGSVSPSGLSPRRRPWPPPTHPRDPSRRGSWTGAAPFSGSARSSSSLTASAWAAHAAIARALSVTNRPTRLGTRSASCSANRPTSWDARRPRCVHLAASQLAGVADGSGTGRSRSRVARLAVRAASRLVMPT